MQLQRAILSSCALTFFSCSGLLGCLASSTSSSNWILNPARQSICNYLFPPINAKLKDRGSVDASSSLDLEDGGTVPFDFLQATWAWTSRAANHWVGTGLGIAAETAAASRTEFTWGRRQGGSRRNFLWYLLLLIFKKHPAAFSILTFTD